MGSITIGTRTVTGINIGTGIDVGTKQTSIGTNGVYDVNVFGYASNEITVAVPSVTPVGTMPINANGDYDVTNYSGVSVQVPSSAVGTVTISTNGTYDVSSYAAAVVSVSTEQPSGDGDFLCFTATDSNSPTIELQIGSEVPHLTLYKSADKDNWSSWDGSAITLQNLGDKVYIYGDNEYISNNSYAAATSRFVISGGNVAASGDVMTLLSRSGQRPMGRYAFYGLFYGCTNLTSVPRIPSKELTDGCYGYMFQGCTSITSTAEIPSDAETAYACFQYMYSGCTSLTTATSLPSGYIANSGAYGMFYGCTALVTAPSMPATYVGSSGYYFMFNGCTSLANVSSLPATRIGDSAYSTMFKGCTSLVTAPSISATVGGESCFSGMFYGCSALTTPPQSISLTNIQKQACYWMFNGCSALTAAPTITANTVGDNGCYNMFFGCTSLTAAPALPATTLGTQCYYSMFNGCTALVTPPPALPAATVPQQAYNNMFNSCTHLASVPVISATTVGQNGFSGMFYKCSTLTAGADLRTVTSVGTSAFTNMYTQCTNLVSAYTPNISGWSTTIFNGWLQAVHSGGTLYRPSGLTVPTGTHGCPSNWTQADYPVLTKTVTFDTTDPDAHGFDYTIGTNSGTITQGFSINGTVSEGETLSITTEAAKAHIYLNGADQGNGPSYTYTFAQLNNGDVFTCFWDSEPS